MELPTTFGEWLSQNRKSLRLTHDELAKRVGCSVSALRKFENGQRRPSAQIAELLANSLNISPGRRPTFVRVARGELGVERLANLMPATPGSSYVAPAAAPRTNLPILPTPMIGRQREVAELNTVLRDPQCRLLTLVGPGGIGKTRLAIESAMHLQDAFSDGVYLVPLVSVSSARFIIPVIADAIGFAFQANGSMDPKAQLLGYLREKQALLLVDNLEHLLADPGIEILTDLLAAAPRVKLLVTSRESPGLPGQWIYEVQGLPIPTGESTQEATENTSVELFLQRARRAHVSFIPTAEDYPAILRICQLVQGMPLAIELASAWVRTLSCAEIEQEIERGLDFLRVSSGEFPPRHRSLRAVFDQSWKLLTAEEQLVLVRLSVFRGGFRREAAEQVARATLSLLNTLVSKSLVRRTEAGRYDLHELIRQFAAEQCADRIEEQTATQARHSDYYLTYFGQADERLRSSAQRETLSELTAEMDNFRAAWDWGTTHHDITRLRQASRTIWYLFELRSWFVEGEATFRDAAEALCSRAVETDPGNETLTIANALRAHSAFFSFRLGKVTVSHAILLKTAEYLQSSTDQFAATCALWYLGVACWILGKYTDANRSLSASLEKARALGEQWYESMAGQLIGIVALDTSDHDLARHYLLEALLAARKTGDPTLIAHTLIFLGEAMHALGEIAEAQMHLRESLAVAREIGWRHGIGRSLDGLGQLAQVTNHTEARMLFAASCDVFRESGDLRTLALVCNHQGYNSLALGDAVDAQASFIAALRLAYEGGYGPYASDALIGMANLQAKQGNRERALELLLTVLNHPASSESTRKRATQLRDEWSAQLRPEQVESALAGASSMRFEDTVASVLKSGMAGEAAS